MYLIATGKATEQQLIRKNLLLAGGPGIATKRDDAMLRDGSKVRGREARQQQCLVPNCEKQIRNQRGLCVTHHSYARDLIRKGGATEEDLIRRGLLRAKQIGGSPATTKGVSRPKAVPVRKKGVPPGLVRKYQAIKKCLVPKCKSSQIHARGLCRNHYSEAKKLIGRGRTTEADLISRKLMLAKTEHASQSKVANDVFSANSSVTGKSAKGKCNYPKCAQPHEIRGLCLKHYLYAMRLKREGKATEADLMKRKLLLSKKFES